MLSNLVLHLRGHFEVPAAAWLAATPSVSARLIAEDWGDLKDLRTEADTSLHWSIREALLAKRPAPEVSETGALVGAVDVISFLRNNTIDVDVRAHVGSNLSNLLMTDIAAENANEISNFFNVHSISLGLDKIHALAAAGASRVALVALLNMPAVRNEFGADPATTLKILGGIYAAVVERGFPSPKFAPTPEHRVFLEILEGFGILRRRETKLDGMLRVRREF